VEEVVPAVKMVYLLQFLTIKLKQPEVYTAVAVLVVLAETLVQVPQVL
jgi:hypothetical protein